MPPAPPSNPRYTEDKGSPEGKTPDARLISSHLFLNREGRWGTIDVFATSLLPALWHSANPRPVHSLMLSSHLFLCLPCLLSPFTVPFKVVLARHCSLPLQFASLYGGQVFLRSNCLLDLGTDFLVGNMIFVGDV